MDTTVALGHPKSTGILRVDGLSVGPLDLGLHIDTIGQRPTESHC